jgi:hypothetical protein
VIFAVSATAVVGLILVQRFVLSEVRQRHNDVAGFIYAVLGVVYAVVLGLVLIAVWEDYREARDIVESEANALAEIYWLAHRMPAPDNFQLQRLARAYARKAADEEWLLMEQGRTSAVDWRLLDDIRVTLQGFKPRTRATQEIYAEGLEQVQGLADARRTRLIAAKETIPIVLWVVLVVGAITVIGFTYLFGLEATLIHRLMVVALAAVTALILFTIGTLDHPFSGGARVGPDAFELILNRFKTSKLSTLW